MKLIVKKVVPSQTVDEEYYVAQCVKCDSDEIKIEEYEDNYGFISTATCMNCKNQVREDTSKVGVIKSWNNQNDIPTLIKNKSEDIISLRDQIRQLKLEQKKEANQPKNNESYLLTPTMGNTCCNWCEEN